MAAEVSASSPASAREQGSPHRWEEAPADLPVECKTLVAGTTFDGKPVPHSFNRAWDNEIWGYFKPHDGDVVVASAYKSGTTWTQAMVAEICGKKIKRNVLQECPWLESSPGTNPGSPLPNFSLKPSWTCWPNWIVHLLC
eukprot:m.67199 g.67199  ORF g.67199 m.67199 type:complete len:140 (-) comp12159_c1_seq4:1147-1566(-)